MTEVPLLDMIINIDWFTGHFEDRTKVLRIIKELFNHCTAMKKFLNKHAFLIMAVLISKYDQQCHLFQNRTYLLEKARRSEESKSTHDLEALENRDEFLAVIIGQLIRLYAKSKSLSQVFCNFTILERMVKLMEHEQYIIQSDAQKTFEVIMKGPRIFESGKMDHFVHWIEKDIDGQVKPKLNKLFFQMRNSNIYCFKRLTMKI